ncbi:hypothetical protein MMC18_005466 [Xylographa bjoerkii]|nr:hypothetical protein [Xylographa bjoerkii]
MVKLASCYLRSGKYDAAEKLLVPALKTMREILGEENMDVFFTENQLAALYQTQLKFSKSDILYKKFSEAETMSKQALEMSLKVYGKGHPISLRLKFHLARSLTGLGRLDESKALLDEVLMVEREVLGDEHPNTLTTMCSIADMKRKKGELLAAKDIQSRYSLGEVMWEQGDKAAAKKILQETWQQRKEFLGEDHPDTLFCLASIANNNYKEGDLAEARKMYEEVLKTRRRVLSEEHEYTLLSKQDLGEVLWRQGDNARAFDLLEEALEGRRKVLGEEHEDTLHNKQYLGVMFFNQGHWTKASTLLVEALKGRRRVLGMDHPSTLSNLRQVTYVKYVLEDENYIIGWRRFLADASFVENGNDDK